MTATNKTKSTLETQGNLASGEAYQVAHLGPLDKIEQYPLVLPDREVRGKVFIKDLIGTTGSEISINKLPAGGAVPFSHAHKQNEEVYLFVKGQGQMAIDEDVFEVKEGSIVRLAPRAVRCLRNNGQEDLYFIVIQTKEGSLGQHTFDDGIRLEHKINW